MLPWKQDKARSRRGGGWSQLLITANGPERAGKVHESSQARCHHAQHLRALAQTTPHGPVIEMRAVLWFFDDSCTFPIPHASVRDANEGPPSVCGHWKHALLVGTCSTGHAM